jgi:AcrR family transcriptional regulator
LISKAKPRWSRRPDARPEEILEAALDTFRHCGFARARLEEVAKRAGVSKGTVYLYFDSKEALFREAVTARLSSVFVAQDALIRDFQGSSRDLLIELIRHIWSVIRTSEMCDISRLVLAEIGAFPELARFWLDEVVFRTRAQVAAVLERGVAGGEFRRGRHDFAVRAIPALIVKTAEFQRVFGPHDPESLSDEEVVEGICDFILRGVLAQPDDRETR